MAEADKRLYMAKSRGRNRVVSDDLADAVSRSA
jgi:PleD family two-component response regulator